MDDFNVKLDALTRKLEKEMAIHFGAPEGSIVFMYAAHKPEMPPPNVWVNTHPMLQQDETFQRMAKELAVYVREHTPKDVWGENE